MPDCPLWCEALGKKCRKIAGILPENFCVPFRSVFYPFLEKKTGIARMESGKKKNPFFFRFFSGLRFLKTEKNGFFFASVFFSVFCPFFHSKNGIWRTKTAKIFNPFFLRFFFRFFIFKTVKKTQSGF